jgi:glycosyltransferase involved in cell wall biosynthesis
MDELIKIYVDENEFDFIEKEPHDSKDLKLSAETSVRRLKRDFFNTLAELAEIRRYDSSKVKGDKSFECALQEHDALVASFHEPPPHIPCRLLQHTKGGLMLTGGFTGEWTFRDATLNLVETTRQKKQIEDAFGNDSPHLGVFAQHLAVDTFCLPVERSVQNYKKRSGPNLVYAGRIIPNKGLIQAIRCLNIWPTPGISLTIVGGFEPGFWFSQCNANSALFEDYFVREGIRRNQCIRIEILPAVRKERLVRKFWESDIFIYPSFHEDEASGNAAHEAVLSGIPAIVTDWCGLGQLGVNTRGGAIKTYPTLGGVRFSLLELRDRIQHVSSQAYDNGQAYSDAEWVASTFDPKWMKNSLSESLKSLLEKPVLPPLPGGWRCKSRIDQLRASTPKGLADALSSNSPADKEGVYVDGTAFSDEFYSESKFLKAVQSLYTTTPETPQLKSGDLLHGFWRVKLWDDENALVEFGFPGPRLLRFDERNWAFLKKSAIKKRNDEYEFMVRDKHSVTILQHAVDLGYLVPNNF